MLLNKRQQKTKSFYGPFSGTTPVNWDQKNKPFWISCGVAPVGTACPPTLCRSCPQVHWLAYQQTILRWWHTSADRHDPWDFIPDALPVATLVIHPGATEQWKVLAEVFSCSTQSMNVTNGWTDRQKNGEHDCSIYCTCTARCGKKCNQRSGQC